MQFREKPLKIFGPSGLKRVIDAVDNANDYSLLDQPFPVEIVEVEPRESFKIADGITAVAAKTPHTPESLALHITGQNGATLVYSSDTGISEPLTGFARHVDLLILECSFVRYKPTENHLELAEAIYTINKAEPRFAVLTHLYPQWDGVELVDELGDLWPRCEVKLAFDGMRMVVTPPAD